MQIWTQKYSKEFEWLKKNGYHGVGSGYTDRDKAIAFGCTLRAHNHVKLLTRNTRIGAYYSIWIKEKL